MILDLWYLKYLIVIPYKYIFYKNNLVVNYCQINFDLCSGFKSSISLIVKQGYYLLLVLFVIKSYVTANLDKWYKKLSKIILFILF